MGKYKVKAGSDILYKRISGILIFIVAAFVCFAAFMAVYTFMGDGDNRIIFGSGYVIAGILGLLYVIMRINSVYATFIAADGDNVYMKNWENDFLPYNTDGSVKFINSFIPAKTKITEIPIEDISSIIIGTKNFIKRYGQGNDDFLKNLRELEHSKDSYEKKQVQGMDLIYIETTYGDSSYMPIVKFNTKAINRLLKYIKRKNTKVEIKTVNKEFKAFKMANTSDTVK